MTLLVKLPIISSRFGNFEEVSKSVLHLSFDVAKVIFNSTIASEDPCERYKLSVL
jgi:hypothetical protein